MTDIATINAGNDPFWTRVRIALTGIRPERRAVIARAVGMKPRLGARLEEELAAAWMHSCERNVSMSLLVVELDRAREYFGSYSKDEADDCLMATMEAIRDTLPRDGDSVLRLGQASFVVVLGDFPALMARATAQKIASAIRDLGLAHKESHAGIVTASVGLAVGNPQGNFDRRFFETAAEALKKAQRRGLNRIEAVDLRPAQGRRRKAA